MTTYHPNLTLGEAVKEYFAANHFGEDGGYNDRWVEVKLGPIPFYIPNTESRVRAVRYHDLHHVLTGYRTDLAGEFEISAWELATGCADFYAAWWLNLLGLIGGLLIWPRRTVFAFLRGRRSKNLYREPYGPALLADTVGAARTRLELANEAHGGMTGADGLSLLGYVLLGLPVAVVSALLGVALLPIALVQNAIGARRREATT